MSACYRNRYAGDLVLRGVSYPPGALIPESVDPGQLAYFLGCGLVELVEECPEPTLEPEVPAVDEPAMDEPAERPESRGRRRSREEE